MFNNVKLGIAPIGWTNDDMPQLGGELTFEQMISEAALAGFQGTEVGGKFPTDPAVLNRALDLRGINFEEGYIAVLDKPLRLTCAVSRLQASGSAAFCAPRHMRRTKRRLSGSWTSLKRWEPAVSMSVN